jgi:hypothetical protein
MLYSGDHGNDLDARRLESVHHLLPRIGTSRGDDGHPELDARRRAPFRDAAAHGHDVDAERLRRSRPDCGDIGPELLVGGTECGQYAEATGFAHGRHELDTAAALHGALQDRIANAQEIADDGVEHGWRSAFRHFAFVPAMRLSEPGMNSCTPTSLKPAAWK